ncbi:unnamed protein product [Leptosia nina]|uniref:Uncharacterized protein n=1 Tax=Leptosia nina TaxID=320188 RepID=A0AAV1JTY6_9NEOP
MYVRGAGRSFVARVRRPAAATRALLQRSARLRPNSPTAPHHINRTPLTPEIFRIISHRGWLSKVENTLRKQNTVITVSKGTNWMAFRMIGITQIHVWCGGGRMGDLAARTCFFVGY